MRRRMALLVAALAAAAILGVVPAQAGGAPGTYIVVLKDAVDSAAVANIHSDKFSARVAYNYRSRFLNGLNRNSAIYQDGVGTVSASVVYSVSKNISVSLEGKDLNDPMLKSYASTPDQPRAFYKNGRQIYFGIRATL